MTNNDLSLKPAELFLKNMRMEGLSSLNTEYSVFQTDPRLLVQNDQWKNSYKEYSEEQLKDFFDEAKHNKKFNSFWANLNSGTVHCNGEIVKCTGAKIILSCNGYTLDINTEIEEERAFNANLGLTTFINDNGEDEIVMRFRNDKGDLTLDDYFAKPDFFYGLFFKESKKGVRIWLIKFSQFGVNSSCEVLCAPDPVALVGLFEDTRALILRASGKELFRG